jgi:hypothetical protein
LDRLDTIKASYNGFEAKTREAQAVVDEAKATVASLRALAVATATFEIDQLAAEGRIGTMAARKDQQKERLLEQLKGLGLSEEQLATVENADSKWVIFDYVVAVLSPLNVNDASKEESKAYARAYSSEPPPTPDECAALLDQFHIDDAQSKELLLDYRYYVATGKQRRPDVWHRRY